MKVHRIQDKNGRGYYLHPQLTPHFTSDEKLTLVTNRISSDLYGGFGPKKGTTYGYTSKYVKSHKKDINNFIKYTNSKYKTTFKIKTINVDKKDIVAGDNDQVQFKGGKK